MLELSQLQIRLLGPLCVTDLNNIDRTPSAAKARALLAVLAVSPNRTRSRDSLRELLWSDRSVAQGRVSLRNSLYKIGERLRPFQAALHSDRRVVSLHADVALDIEPIANTQEWVCERATGAPMPIFFDGVRVEDKAFNHWRDEVREQISRWWERRRVAPTLIVPAAARRPWIQLFVDESTADHRSLFAAVSIGEAIGRAIADMAGIDVVESPREYVGLILHLHTVAASDHIKVHLTLRAGHDRTLLWSLTDEVQAQNAVPHDSPRLKNLLNQAVDIALIQLRTLLSMGESGMAAAFCIEAIHKMYSLERDQLFSADRDLDAAYAIDPQPVFLAWKAFLRNFLVGERVVTNVGEMKSEGADLAHKALKGAPHNANVLALLSRVHGFLLNDRAMGHELAERSLRLNPANTEALTNLSRAKVFLGDLDEGYRLATLARTASGPGPHHYSLLLENCIAAASLGKTSEALRLAQISHVMEPRYRPTLRYLFLLSLRAGDRPRAREAFNKLRFFEPDFSLSLMRDPSYPSAALRQYGFVDLHESEFE